MRAWLRIPCACASIVLSMPGAGAGFPHPEQLYAIWAKEGKGTQHALSPGDFESLKACRSFQDVAAVDPLTLKLRTGDQTIQVKGARVSASFLRLLGTAPLLGRAFLPEEETQRVRDVVVLSHALWRERFQSDPAVIGRVLVIEGLNAMVVGVLPADFHIPTQLELLMPLKQNEASASNRSSQNLQVYARLRAGVKDTAARSELTALARRLAIENPDTNQGRDFVLVSLRGQLSGGWPPAGAPVGMKRG